MCSKALDLILKLTEELRGAKHTENSEGRAFYPDSLPRIFTPNSFRVRFGREIGVALPSSVAQAILPRIPFGAVCGCSTLNPEQ